MFNSEKEQNRKMEGGTVYKEKEEQRTWTGHIPRQKSWATPHLLPQRDLTDTSNPWNQHGVRRGQLLVIY